MHLAQKTFQYEPTYGGKGDASDLYDANISLDKIRAVGYWSFGIFDAYLTFSATQIATWQNLGLACAELRSNHVLWSIINLLNLLFQPEQGGWCAFYIELRDHTVFYRE